MGLDLPSLRFKDRVALRALIQGMLRAVYIAAVQEHNGLSQMRFNSMGIEREDALVITRRVVETACFSENAGTAQQQVGVVRTDADFCIEVLDLLGIGRMRANTRRCGQHDECQAERGERAKNRAKKAQC
ncbi:MAG TPA: hypothetical protein VFR10_01540 [bacterium]|nr:hypothetical protein [bacterium]